MPHFRACSIPMISTTRSTSGIPRALNALALASVALCKIFARSADLKPPVFGSRSRLVIRIRRRCHTIRSVSGCLLCEFPLAHICRDRLAHFHQAHKELVHSNLDTTSITLRESFIKGKNTYRLEVLSAENLSKQLLSPLCVWLAQCRMPTIKKVELDRHGIALAAGRNFVI